MSDKSSAAPSSSHLAMAESTPPSGPQQLQTGDTQPGPSNRTPAPHVIPNSPLSAAQMQVQDSPYRGVFQGSISQFELRPLVPGLVCGSCPPPDLSWVPVNTITIAPESNFGFSPCMFYPVHNPPEVCFLPPPSPVLLPQTVSFYPPCSPDLVTGRAAQVVSQQQREGQAEAGEEWQKNTQSFNNNLQIQTLATLRLTEDQQDQDVEQNQLDSETSRFMEGLDELYSSMELDRALDSILDLDYLDSLLSVGPDLADLSRLDIQEQERYLCPLAADSSSAPPAQRTHAGLPLLSKLLQEPLAPDPTPTFNPASTMSPLHCFDSMVQDWTSRPCSPLFQDCSQGFDWEGGDNGPNREGLAAQTSRTQEGPGPVTVKDPEPGFRPDLELGENLSSEDVDGKFSCLQGEFEDVGTKIDTVLSGQEKERSRGEATKSSVSTQEEKDPVQGKVQRPEGEQRTSDQLSGDLGPAPGPTESREKEDDEEPTKEDGETATGSGAVYNLRSRTRSRTRSKTRSKTGRSEKRKREKDSEVRSRPVKRKRWRRGQRLE
ncbi:uncharacterized protein V6R79_026170 [Siganus canaliculatus]